MKSYIKINEKDNVAVALEDLKSGSKIDVGGCTVVLKEDITRGHKFSLRDISNGENIIKYGNPIGHAKEDINSGCHVHTNNIATNLADIIEYEYTPVEVKKEASFCGEAFFDGFERPDGKVGIRNEVWIVPTVGCVNAIADKIAAECKKYLKGSVSDVLSFTHPYGCSQMGDDQEFTRKALAALVAHPNAGAVLLLGLGCENSSISVVKEYLGKYDENKLRTLQCQDVEDEVSEGIEIVKDLIDYAAGFERKKLPADRLVIGLKCGGSDGLSGITANPVVGTFSDMLTSLGGTTILTEVPEMFGAERLLMDRCISKEVYDKTVSMINNFKDYFKKSGQTIYENPSPGNKAGGISTLEDKALGCTQKSGSSNVMDVLDYADRVQVKGLNLLCAPGNDLVAATSLALSGAQMVLFTTGRGTPFASPVPTMKISTNSSLAGKKSGWIDLDCGVLVTEDEKVDNKAIAEKLFEKVLKVASGEKVKSEAEGYHGMAIWKRGVTL
ncbi:MAG: altronate dehydratase family protein [Lachnospiraceae bacterium]|nr:altronate dehydratase family protein [Lachnospiraceae bacterium]